MRLKQIKLAGFKSFVDITKIPFNHTMTAIVGPNGCGKSNIIDAVRWVLGESSAKNLRGDSMTDVIFNGAASRKPISQASVELLFENIDEKVSTVIGKHDVKSIKNTFADRNQVAIKRLVNRDGTNQYFLNGSKCRQRDITDVFLGTGLGPRSYAIIEQGTISKLIESKPKELRVFIEEAAGISKYKERRKESETSIRHTRENLARLADIQSELNVQIDKLHQQAQAAERFKTLKVQERTLKAELSALRWQECENKNIALEKKLSQHKRKSEDIHLQQNQQDVNLLSYKAKISLDNEQLTNLQKQKLALTQNIVRAEQNIKFSKEQRSQLEKGITDVIQKLSQIEQCLSDSIHKKNAVEKTLTQTLPQLDLEAKNISDLQNKLSQVMKSQEGWQLNWQQHQQKQTEEIQSREQYKTLKNTVKTQQKRLDEKENQKQRVKNKIQRLTQSKESHDECNIDGKLSELFQQLNAQQHTVDNIKNELSSQQSLLTNSQQKLATEKGRQQGVSDRIEHLTHLVNTSSDWQKEQSSWLNERSIDSEKLLHHQIRIDEKWQAALEQVLSVWLQAPIIDKPPKEISLSVAFFIINNVDISKKTKEPKVVGTLAEITDGCDMFNGQLNKIFVAENIKEAQLLLVNLKEDESVICPDTTWLSHSLIRKGNADSSHHVLQQASQLTQLIEQLSALDIDQKQLAITNEQLSTKVTSLTEDLLSNNKVLEDLKNAYDEKRHSCALQQQEQENIAQQVKSLQVELNTLQSDIVVENNILMAAIEQKNAVKVMFNDLVENESKTKESQLQKEQKKYQQRIKVLQTQLQQSHQTHHLLVINAEQAKNKQQQIDLIIEQNQQQKIELQEQHQKLKEEKNTLSTPLSSDSNQLNIWLQDMLIIDEKMQKNYHNQTTYSDEINNIEVKQEKLQAALASNNKKVNEIKLSQERTNAYAFKYIEQLNEHQRDLTDTLDAMPENAKESLWQVKLVKLSDNIQLLGAINLAAIEEYKQQITRKTFLDQQSDDLFEALSTLEEVIATIDKESKLKFKATFDQVNQDLKILFPKVFGGGSAYLALTDNNLLETGVTIMARPPGKKNSTIHLLSGGEKALTALSLVFAIFRLNPAPFCLLDEVDAPLDDANVVRFCNLVKEMSQTVQFIYISHNKIAMEMATHLTGVTMFEAGVSKMVTVDIDEAIAMADLA